MLAWILLKFLVIKAKECRFLTSKKLFPQRLWLLFAQPLNIQTELLMMFLKQLKFVKLMEFRCMQTLLQAVSSFHLYSSWAKLSSNHLILELMELQVLTQMCISMAMLLKDLLSSFTKIQALEDTSFSHLLLGLEEFTFLQLLLVQETEVA